MSSFSNHPNECSARVALLQFHVSGDKARNIETASEFLIEAKKHKAVLSVMPEIWNSPYATSAFEEFAEILPEVGDTKPPTTKEESPSVHFLMEAAKQHQMWIIGGSIPESVISNGGKKIYNTSLCISPRGVIVAKHRKVHLFDIDVPGRITFRESDTLTGGSSISTFEAEGTPLGKIGVGICYDLRFPEFAQCMVQRGCNILVYPGAFNLITGPAHWELLQRARAVDGQCYVLTASPARSKHPSEGTGSNVKYPHYEAWGHSTVVNPWGEVIATSDETAQVVIADIDMSKVYEVRRSIPTSMQKRNDIYQIIDLN